MRIRMLRCFFLFLPVVISLVFIPALAVAQVQPGVPPFSSWSDEVNLPNLNTLLRIPVRTKAGAIPFSYTLVFNNYLAGVQGAPPLGGLGGGPPFGGNIKATHIGGLVCLDHTITTEYYNWRFTDVQGTVHPFSGILVDTKGCLTGSSTGASLADDHTGYYLSVDVSTVPITRTLHDKFGNLLNPPFNEPGLPDGWDFGSSITDPHGNSITYSFPQSGVVAYTDTFGQTPLTWAYGNSLFSNGAPEVYTYTDALGATRTVQVNYSQLTQQTAFGCGWPDIPPTPKYFPTSIYLPDNTSYTLVYESTPPPGNTNNVTGRLALIKLPAGGKISYSYSGGNKGIDCNHIVPPVLTRKLTNTDDTVATWTYTYNWNNGYPLITVVDAMNNETDYSFSNSLETQRLVYSGNGSNKTLLLTKLNCYNANLVNCTSSSVTPPITQVDTFTTPAGNATSSHTQSTFDVDGDLTETKTFDYGASSPTIDRILTYGTYSNGSCTGIGNYIASRVCTDVTKVNGSVVSQTNTSYSGTGNPGTVSKLTGGTTYLTSTASFNANGTVNIAQDENGTRYTYTYGPCNALLPTGVSISGTGVSLSRSMTWDCNGGVLTSVTDENHNPTTYNYVQNGVADPFYRVLNTVDAGGNTTYSTYPSQTEFESSMTFNSNQSIQDVNSVHDGFGRRVLGQALQGPSAPMWDTTQYTYDADGRLATTRMPCSAAKVSVWSGQDVCSTPVTTYGYDGLNRLSLTTDGGGGTVSSTPNGKDVVVTAGPPPANENVKSKQMEYDGLGRLRSVCEITQATGSGNCAQANSKTGYWTKYDYDTTTVGSVVYSRTTVTQNAQGTPTQTRTFLYDGLGRLTSETNPEWGPGTATYAYDVACGTYPASAGDMTTRIDNAGNKTCYNYDGLHRLIDAGLTGPSCHHYRYDTNATPPGGVTVSNTAGRMEEAFTDNCGSTLLTDEWFGYDALGRNTDFYQSTQHYPSYTHLTAQYFANGALQTLGGIPSQSGWSFGLDGEGRPYSAVSGTTNWVTSVLYPNDPTPNQLSISYANGDSDSYIYYSNTGRLQTHTAKIGSSQTTVQESLNWNPNGSLLQLQISNGFHSAQNQTCNYLYDDLGRSGLKPTLNSPPNYAVDCGSTHWQQMFTYDPFGNITKSGSQSWMPGYDSSTNHYTLGGTSYDANGNLLADTFHNYSWDPNFGFASSVDSISLTYDALNRMVEQKEPNGSYNEILYSPIGKIAVMNGTIPNYASVPLPGGNFAWVPGASAEPKSIEHKDWLGSTRLLSAFSMRNDFFDTAYAPFGEAYSTNGNTAGLNFTGQYQDTVPGLYDFLYREYHPAQGRWISPDPAGIGAVDFSNPQSLNRYAYVGNMPLNTVDSLGLIGILARCPDGLDIDPGCNNIYGVPAGHGLGIMGVGSPFTPLDLWAFDSLFFLPGDEIFVPIKPLPPALTQAIISAITGNWRGVLDAALSPIEQGLWGRALNPILDATDDGRCYYVLVNPCGAANNEDPTYANRIHALFQTPETANIWKQADCTISGPLKDELGGLADTGATAAATGAITAKSLGTPVTKGISKELGGAFTTLFGIIEYGKTMLKVGYNMVAGCH